MAAELVANCPRCGAQSITFDLTQEHHYRTDYGWQYWFEAFCVCRRCKRSTIFLLSQNVDVDKEPVHRSGLVKVGGAVNRYMDIEGFINIKDTASTAPPDHVPKDIKTVFQEGATCLAVNCYNAAGTMFRLCVDLATRSKLPKDDAEGLNAKVRRDLGLRLPWLFDQGLLPGDLRELSTCVKDDGNDGAHAGTLKKEDAEDLLDFTSALLERMYTEPERLRLAKKRRDKRRERSRTQQ